MEISVVIPVYNRCTELKKALESLCIQTFSEFEVIIIDDGSDDNIFDTVKQYSNLLSLRYIRKEHTGNIAMLRNCGLYIAKGKYIAVLDSDDSCSPERLKMQYLYLEKNPNIDILSTWVNIIDECHSDNSLRLERLYNMTGDNMQILIRSLNEGCCICNSTVMMRKDRIIYLGGYDEHMCISEDFNLWLRALLKNYKIHIMDEKLVYRKIHMDSVTAGYDGSECAIEYVITNKLMYIFQSGLLSKRKIYVWGECSRNNVVFKVLSECFNYNEHIEVVNVYEEFPEIERNAFHMVTTYSSQKKVFDYFQIKGLNILKDYIYV